MYQLPEYVLFMIFDYLDDQSILNTMLASKYVANIIAGSTKLLSKFELILDQKNLSIISNCEELPVVPIKNLKIIDFASRKARLSVLENYQASIERIKLEGIEFQSIQQLIQIFTNLNSLETIVLDHIEIESDYDNINIPFIPSLRSVTFNEGDRNLLKIFHLQKGIEKISITRLGWMDSFSSATFNSLAEKLPNLKHLVMIGHGTSRYFDFRSFPFKIEKLEVFLMTFDWHYTDPRLRFLKSQQGHLKELKMHKLPYDFDGDKVLKFIVENMGLETFYYGETPLILNGQKQAVKEFMVQEVQIQSAFEMFRQFPTIEKFTLFVTLTALNDDAIKQIVNPRTKLFSNAKELKILDHNHNRHLIKLFVGLYKNFRNIRKLSVISNDSTLNSVLLECLPEMTQLNEIFLDTTLPNPVERFQAISNFAPNIRKLSVAAEFVNQAREFFRNEELEIVAT